MDMLKALLWGLVRIAVGVVAFYLLIELSPAIGRLINRWLTNGPPFTTPTP